MSGLMEIAASVLATSEKRLETVSHNVANTGTAGFKKQVVFADLVSGAGTDRAGQTASVMGPSGAEALNMKSMAQFTQGKLNQTGNALDLALSGQGLFMVSDGTTSYFTRQGTFALGDDGRMVNTDGMALQSASGGDVRLDSATPEILTDGTIMEQGVPTGKIGVFDADDRAVLRAVGGSLFQVDAAEMTEVQAPNIRQGMTEAANVTLSEEMVTMMEALRQAEMGSRMVQTYDTLIGQAISTFGQGAN